MHSIFIVTIILLHALIGQALWAIELNPEISGNASKAKTFMCMGCHGIPGYRASYPEVYRVPTLNGQHSKYLIAALKAYRSGERKHPTMRSVAISLSDQEIADLAVYYANNNKLAQTMLVESQPKEVLRRGKNLVERSDCFSCHGADFKTSLSPEYPKIAGQYPDYIFQALMAYKNKDHRLLGRNNAIMAPHAAFFTKEQLKDIAAYISSLP